MTEKVSRGYYKLEHALKEFKVDVDGKICADLGSSTGGFVECLLDSGASKVYAVEKGYGVLEWKLRKDDRVKVMERTNALHVKLPELVDVVTIDAGWTKQSQIIPKALELLKNGGVIVSLIKPHYEADKKYLKKGKLEEEYIDEVVEGVLEELGKLCINDLVIHKTVDSPILGAKGGNKEFLMFASRH